MKFLTRHLTRLLFPLLLKVDFRDPRWKGSTLEARSWLLSSVFISLLAQALVGQLTAATALVILLSPLGVWWLSDRIVLTMGYLQVAIALVSLLLVFWLLLLGVPPILVQAATGVWQLWGLVVVVVLFVRYLRTPKAQMA